MQLYRLRVPLSEFPSQHRHRSGPPEQHTTAREVTLSPTCSTASFEIRIAEHLFLGLQVETDSAVAA